MSAAAEVITVTVGGKTFRAGRRTAAHLLRTHAAFEREFPDLVLYVAQPCYNDSVPASAGTHDRDGVVDWFVLRNGGQVDVPTYFRVQRFLRSLGWGCWVRHTGAWASIGNRHIHGVSLGCPGPVGIYVPGQIDDYYRHTFGLADQHNTDLDKSWFPGDKGDPPWPVGTPEQWRAAINRTVFDYEAWVEENEMPSAQEIAREVVNTEIIIDGKPMRLGRVIAAIHRQSQVGGKLGELARDLEKLLAESKEDATKVQGQRILERVREVKQLIDADQPDAPQG